MMQVLVLYYSQTGQLKNIVDSIASSWKESENISVDFVNYKPQNDYPFPWSSDAFFDVFPECREGISSPTKDLEMDYNKHYDLVVFAYQVWYLSPSIPAWSILNNKKLSQFLKGKNIITVLGVRNMWVQAHYRVHAQLERLKAKHVGNIVLSDPTNNFVSVITVIKWLIDGKQGPSGIWPRSGVPEKRIEEAKTYGQIIKKVFSENRFEDLQVKLVNARAVDINFTLRILEFNGYRIFGVWSKFILKKGVSGDKNRLFRVRAFKYYLLFIIFGLAPIASIIFSIINFVFYPLVQKNLKKISLMK